MSFRGSIIAAVVCAFLAAPAFGAEWYVNYEKGYKAVDKGKCAEGVPLLKEAIGKNPKADLKARPYGMISWEYIPYYYLAKCALESGDYAGAKSYADTAMQVDMYSSSKATEFRQIQKSLDEKLGNVKKPPVNPTTNTTTPTIPAKPPGNKTPGSTTPTNPPDVSGDRQQFINQYLNNARMSYAAGDYNSANDAIDRVLVLDASNSEALKLRMQIAQKQSANQDAQYKKQKIGDARRALSRGDLGSAENIALELKSDFPNDPNVTSLANEIDRAKAEKMKTMQADESKKFVERQVISAFYTGKYNAAVELAEANVKQFPDSWRLLFYQGCAYSALSILEDKNKDQRLNSAREAFRKAKSAAGADITQPPQISPKIWDVYRSS